MTRRYIKQIPQNISLVIRVLSAYRSSECLLEVKPPFDPSCRSVCWLVGRLICHYFPKEREVSLRWSCRRPYFFLTLLNGNLFIFYLGPIQKLKKKPSILKQALCNVTFSNGQSDERTVKVGEEVVLSLTVTYTYPKPMFWWKGLYTKWWYTYVAENCSELISNTYTYVLYYLLLKG